MAARISKTFSKSKDSLQIILTFLGRGSKSVFVAYLTAGFPSREDTVEAMLGLEEGGADIIELGAK